MNLGRSTVFRSIFCRSHISVNSFSLFVCPLESKSKGEFALMFHSLASKLDYDLIRCFRALFLCHEFTTNMAQIVGAPQGERGSKRGRVDSGRESGLLWAREGTPGCGEFTRHETKQDSCAEAALAGSEMPQLVSVSSS